MCYKTALSTAQVYPSEVFLTSAEPLEGAFGYVCELSVGHIRHFQVE